MTKLDNPSKTEPNSRIGFTGRNSPRLGFAHLDLNGDSIGYADNFQDALGILEEKITELGGTTVGYWSTDGYDFNESKALKNDNFVGLALDEDNQPELTDNRIKAWVTQLKKEFGV